MTEAFIRHQSSAGSALLLGMVLLFSLTLLATSLAAEYRFQSRIQTNQEWSDRATRSALGALSDAERWLQMLTASDKPEPCADRCTSSHRIWQADAMPLDVDMHDLDWWENHAQGDTADEDGMGYWLVSEIDVPPEHLERLQWPVNYYRIVALGTGRQRAARFIAESIFIKPWINPAPEEGSPEWAEITQPCRPTADPPCGRVAWRRLR